MTTKDLNIRANFFSDVVLEVGSRIFKNTSATNISIGGMFVSIQDDLPAVGQTGTISLQYEKAGETLGFVASCKVAWQRGSADSNRKRGVGIRYTEMDRKSLQALREIVDNQLKSAGPQQGELTYKSGTAAA